MTKVLMVSEDVNDLRYIIWPCMAEGEVHIAIHGADEEAPGSDAWILQEWVSTRMLVVKPGVWMLQSLNQHHVRFI